VWEEGKGNSNLSDQDGVVCGTDYPVMKQTCSLGFVSYSHIQGTTTSGGAGYLGW